MHCFIIIRWPKIDFKYILGYMKNIETHCFWSALKDWEAIETYFYSSHFEIYFSLILLHCSYLFFMGKLIDRVAYISGLFFHPRPFLLHSLVCVPGTLQKALLPQSPVMQTAQAVFLFSVSNFLFSVSLDTVSCLFSKLVFTAF